MSTLALGLLLATSLQAANPPWRYQLRLEPGSERLQVQVCAPENQGPPELEALDRPALEHIEPGPGWRLDRERWVLRRSAGQCGDYAVDLGALADRRRRGHGYRVGDDLLTWPDAWLWWPRPQQAQALLDFELPAGWQISAPWPQPDPQRLQFRLGEWPREWDAMVAFGAFERRRLQGSAAGIRLAFLGDLPAAKREGLSDWVTHLAGLLEPIGGLPLTHSQVLVVPIGRGRSPVPWGQVYRAGSGGVQFFIDPSQPLEAFYADWTGAHEFSHLLHPYLGRRGRWLSEGLASYYQNVLRGISGDLSESQAWSNLLAGFGRGRRDASNGTPLRQVAREMYNRRAYMRIYWSGAAWWLQRDVELRLLLGADQGLDRLLARFGERHLPAQRTWSAEAFAAELDRLAGVQVFAASLAEAEAASHFPDLSELQQRLGLRTDGAGELRALDDEAELAPLRRAIMRQGASAAPG